ncbi:MAG: hypothetical protein AAGF84_08855 [Planctomycetota bacterium]
MLVSSGEASTDESPDEAGLGGGSGSTAAGVGGVSARASARRWTCAGSIRQIVWHEAQTVTAPGRTKA